MKVKVFFLLFYSVLSAQHLDSVKAILQSKSIKASVKEGKIDSFLEGNRTQIDSLELAECYHEYGKWFYKKSMKAKRKDNLYKAIEFTKKSLYLKENLKFSEGSVKKALYNIGYFHSELGNYYQAIKYYQKVKEVSVSKKLDKITLHALEGLSMCYMKTGDYHKSLSNLNAVISKSLKDKSFVDNTIYGYITKAKILAIMGRKEFNAKIKENLFLADSLLVNIDASPYSYYYYEISQAQGNRLLENRKPKQAIPFFEKSLKGVLRNTLTKSKTQKDSFDLAVIHNSIGNSFRELKNDSLTKYHLKKAILYNKTYSIPYENLGDLYIEKEEFQQAIESYQLAINTQLLNEVKGVYKQIPLGNLEEGRNKYYLLHHIIQKAKGWVKYYYYDKDLKKLEYALETFKAADQLIDIIRFESTEYKSKLYWRKQGASLYQGAVAVCYLLNKPKEAFYFMEKNKAILLLEDISNHQAIKNANIPITIAQKQEELKTEIHQIQNKLQITNVLENEDVKRELYLSKRKYTKFVDSLMVAYPDYGKYKKKIPVLSYEEGYKNYSSEDTSVLHYIINDEGGFGLLMNNDKPLLFKIDEPKELSKEIKIFKQLVSQKVTTNEQQQEFFSVSNAIFKKIIPEEAYQKIKGKKVTIIPDYNLQEVSFETLMTSQESNSFLLKDIEIHYAYSLSYLENNNKIIRNTTKDFLGIAPVHFDVLGLPTLNYSLPEVSAVQEIFSGESLLRKEATKEFFLNKANEYAVLHLATHADVNNINVPWVAFNDDKLSLEEVYAYKNQHEIVTLSACETSLGKMQEGEGVLSLARGFFYGGAKSVVNLKKEPQNQQH